MDRNTAIKERPAHTGKHIVLLNRSFWPDVEATGQFFTELCQALAQEYKVTVVCGQPYFTEARDLRGWGLAQRETREGIAIVRVKSTTFRKENLVGRFLNWLSYSAWCSIVMLGIKADLVIIGTDPPFLGIIAAAIKKMRSTQFVFNCRDLYPDVAIGLGKLGKKNLCAVAFDAINRKALGAARLVVCLGESMEKLIRAKGIAQAQIRIIPDWVDTTMIKPIEKKDNFLLEKLSLAYKFIFMYSGNIGLSQGFETLIEAFGTIDPRDACLVFIGDGAGKAKLKRDVARAGLANVVFLPYQPLSMLAYSLSLADLHLIPLKKGLAGAIVPSKVYGILAAGRPYLAITDRESEPALLAEEYGCGLWAQPQDTAGISEKMRWAISHQEELRVMGNAGRALAQAKFDKRIVISEWKSLCKEIL